MQQYLQFIDLPLQEDHTLLVAAKRENSRRKIVGKDVPLFTRSTAVIWLKDSNRVCRGLTL